MSELFLKSIMILALCAASSVFAASDQYDKHEQDRIQLRALLVDIEKGVNDNDTDYLKQYLDENVVITHQNAHVAKGVEEFVAYNDKMTKGPDAAIKKLTTKASLGGPAYFHGDDVAIGYGTAVDTVELASGMSFDLEVAWSATLIKKGGQWKAAAIHFSTNVLDNSILNRTKDMIWQAGLVVAIIALGIGLFAGRKFAAR